MIHAVVLAVFFLSGMSGLVYQVIWVRLFGNVFGNTVYSAAAVTAVFMFGLGVGGYLIGRRADAAFLRDTVRPLRLYGYAEMAIGLWCLGIAALLPNLTALSALSSSYTVAADGWYELSFSSYAIRYAAAVLLLAPPTLLMGGTLTLLIRFLVARRVELAGWRIGLLYSVNTLGAAGGCFLTDHALVPALGIFQTQVCAVVLNWVAGAGALLLARSRRPQTAAAIEAATEPSAAAPTADARARRTAAALFLSGFAALGMEIVWFRLLISILGGYRSVFSIVLTVMLIGIWAGALLGGWLHRRWQRPALSYVLTQCTFACSAIVLIWAYSGDFVSAHALAVQSAYQEESAFGRWIMDTWANGRVALFLMGLPALFLGFTFPLGNGLVQRSEREVGGKAGALYLANTGGNVAGALVAGFVLLTLFGMQVSLSICAASAVVSALLLYPFVASESAAAGARRAPRGLAVFSIAAAAAALVAFTALPSRLLIDRMFEFSRSGNETVIVMHEGVNETLLVTEFSQGGRRLHTNGHRMSSTALFTQRYMRAAAHIPLLQLDAPRSVLNIAFGVGNTLHAASLHPTVERLEVVDLSRAILEHAHHFSHSNRDVLSDPRVRVFVNDGRLHLLMREPDAYDLITLEPPPINFAGTAALYTVEFYELARSRLRPGGYLTQWLPSHQLPGDAGLSLVRAFVEVFPQSVLLGSYRDLILLGVKGDAIAMDIGSVADRLAARPRVREDLKSMRMANPTDLVGSFVASYETMRRVSAGVPALVDDRPLNEYAARSNLMINVQPRELFDVGDAETWCPDCFSEELLSDALSDLPAYLEIMQQVYSSRAFLVDAPERAPPARIDWQTPARRRAIQRSPWLQILLEKVM